MNLRGETLTYPAKQTEFQESIIHAQGPLPAIRDAPLTKRVSNLLGRTSDPYARNQP